MKTREVPRELEAGSEPMELERKRPLDPEEPRVGLAPWETAGQRSVAAEVQVEQMPGSRRGKSARKPRGLQTLCLEARQLAAWPSPSLEKYFLSPFWAPGTAFGTRAAVSPRQA